jgi:hypothetical protein
MFRTELAADRGMLFKFPNRGFHGMWGLNTYLPLDVAFVNPQGRIICIKEIVPHNTKIVRSEGICDLAIEANAGFFEKSGIQSGDKVEIEQNGDEAVVRFIK